jgi:acetyltransferase-like isoleucine patch superfamily enzyme
LGNNSSQGFWLQGNTGNARFGNNISIGNSLTVGTNANISANLRIGNSVVIGGSANIGNNATIGNNITIGNVVSIGNSLTVGANANIGTNANVGANLTVGANLRVGNNASIGGNLTVAGLITGSGTGAVLNANTVITTTLFPASVTSSAGVSYGDQYMSSNAAVANTVYTIGGPTIVTSVTNQQVIAWWQGGLEINFGVALGNSCQFNGTINLILCRYPTATPSSVTTLFTVGRSINVSGVTFPGASYSYYNVALPTYIDSLATPDSYTYAWGAYYTVISSSGTFTRTFKLTTLGNPNLNGGYAINSIVALGTKR